MSDDKQLATVEHSSKKAPILADKRGVQLASMEDMWRFATCVVNSGLAPKSFTSPEAIVIAIQSGAEIGLSPMQALQNLCVINGKVGIYGPASLAVCMRDAAFQDIEEWYEVDGKRVTDEEVGALLKANKNAVAVCVIRTKDRTPVRRSFSVEDAKRAKLWEKRGHNGSDTPWITYPARMLRWKARHFAENDALPNALKGIPMAEDLQSGEYETQPAVRAEIVEPQEILPPDPKIKCDGDHPAPACGSDHCWHLDPDKETKPAAEMGKGEPDLF